MYKRKITVLFVVLNIVYLKGQTTYYPIPDSNVVWMYDLFDGNCMPFGLCGNLYYTIQGDTLIGIHHYKKVLQSTNGANYVFIGGIRQDIISQKVFVIKNGTCNSMDTLLYDFSHQVGDTIMQCIDLTGADPVYIISVDSVMVSNSIRKRLNLNINSSIIEGIGSTSGLLGPWNGWIGGYLSLKCFAVDGMSLFPNNSCNLSNEVGSRSILPKIDVQILPNPIAEKAIINVELPFSLGIQICAINQMGIKKTILHKMLKSGVNPILFDTDDYSSGLYILRITSDDNSISIKKLIEIIH